MRVVFFVLAVCALSVVADSGDQKQSTLNCLYVNNGVEEAEPCRTLPDCIGMCCTKLSKTHKDNEAINSDCRAGWTETPMAEFTTLDGRTVEGVACFDECTKSLTPVEVPYKYRKELITYCTVCDDSLEICKTYGAGFVAKTSGIVVAIVALLFLVL